MDKKYGFVINYLNRLIQWRFKEGYSQGYEDGKNALPARYICQKAVIELRKAEDRPKAISDANALYLYLLDEKPDGATPEQMMTDLELNRNALYNAFHKLAQEGKIEKTEGSRPVVYKAKKSS